MIIKEPTVLAVNNTVVKKQNGKIALGRIKSIDGEGFTSDGSDGIIDANAPVNFFKEDEFTESEKYEIVNDIHE